MAIATEQDEIAITVVARIAVGMVNFQVPPLLLAEIAGPVRGQHQLIYDRVF